MAYYLPDELKELRKLQKQLKAARAHSPKAVAIGRKIATIDGVAAKRAHTGPTPAWMVRLSKQMGLECKPQDCVRCPQAKTCLRIYKGNKVIKINKMKEGEVR